MKTSTPRLLHFGLLALGIGAAASSPLACGSDSGGLFGAGGAGGEGSADQGASTTTTTTTTTSTSTSMSTSSQVTSTGQGGETGATGGSGTTGQGGGGAATTGQGGQGGGGVTTGQGGGVSTGQGGGVTTGQGGSSGQGGGAPCPDATGFYGTIMTQGLGCGDIDASSPACVTGNGTCADDAASGPSVNGGSINGQFQLQADGTFTGAAIRLGSAQRTGCTGSFVAGTLTVICGGTNPASTQYCAVTLTRTGGACGEDPRALIFHPGDGETRSNSSPIPFIGQATDPQDGALSGASLVWVDSIEGQIGTGTSFNATLPTPGVHTVTLTATDLDGNTGVDSITLKIVP